VSQSTMDFVSQGFIKRVRGQPAGFPGGSKF
jgi:hypothetical protein